MDQILDCNNLDENLYLKIFFLTIQLRHIRAKMKKKFFYLFDSNLHRFDLSSEFLCNNNPIL